MAAIEDADAEERRSSPDALPSSQPPSRSCEHDRTSPIVIIDRSAIYRAGLQHILEDRGFRIAASCAALTDIEEAVLQRASAALIDVGTERARLLPAVASLVQRGLRVVVLTEHVDAQEAIDAIATGAASYFQKSEITPELVSKLTEVILSIPATVISRSVIELWPHRAVADKETAPSAHGPAMVPQGEGLNSEDKRIKLSNQERAIVDLLTQDGATNKEIARTLNIAEATVKVHVKSLLRKSGAKNRTQAAMWALKSQ